MFLINFVGVSIFTTIAYKAFRRTSPYYWLDKRD